MNLPKTSGYVATPTIVDLPADETSSTGTGASKPSKSSKGKYKKDKKPGLKARYPNRGYIWTPTIPFDESDQFPKLLHLQKRNQSRYHPLLRLLRQMKLSLQVFLKGSGLAKKHVISDPIPSHGNLQIMKHALSKYDWVLILVELLILLSTLLSLWTSILCYCWSFSSCKE